MDSRTFVIQLGRLAPSVPQLERLGFTHGQIDDFRKSFLCQERQSENTETNELLRLLIEWDLSQIQVGMVRFLSKPEQVSSDRVCIGSVEADPLVLLYRTGEIVVEESGMPDHILWAAAKNGPMFLDALILAAEFLSKRSVGEIDYEDNSAAWGMVERCASLAGGDKYLRFYSMLLGAY